MRTGRSLLRSRPRAILSENTKGLTEMIDNSMKDSLRPRLKDYVSLITVPSPKAGRGKYVCPLCGSGDHRKKTGAFHVTGEVWYCSACKRGGDIFDLYALIHGLDIEKDFPKIVEGLASELGVTALVSPKKEAKPTRQKAEEVKKEVIKNPEAAAQIESYANKIAGSPAEEYFHGRGFSDRAIERFKLGYNDETGRAVIPYPGIDYKIERALDPEADRKYLYPSGGSVPLFMIKDNESDTFFVTEGQLDAISMWQAGARNVIAIGGGSYRLLEDAKIARAIIVADRDPEEKRSERDNLTPGERTAKNIEKLFSERGVKSITVFPPEGFKDANDILKKDQKILTEALSGWAKKLAEAPEPKAPAGALESFNVGSYLSENIFDEDIKYFSQYKDRKTGFENLDRYLTLYPGVACLGGASSLGKTTFAVNLVDNLLGQGESVVYFSLEQLPIELVTKSLARQVREIDPFSPIKNIDIKNGASSLVLEEVKKEYAEFAKNYQIVQGDFHLTAKRIVEHVEAYIKKTGVRPVVVIDYLQLIAPPEGFKGGQREIVDENLKAIKDLSKRNELFILLISSFNRTSYKEPVSMESFKESGGIEYTCDYILGLQLSILEDPSFFSTTGRFGGEKDTNNDKKSKALDEAIGKNPKEVELVVLKNRNGKQRFKNFFVYYTEFDAFEVDKVSKFERFVKKGGATQNNALEGLTGMRAI